MSHTPRHLTLFVANFETDVLDSVGQDAVTLMSAYKSHRTIMVGFLWNTVVWDCCTRAAICVLLIGYCISRVLESLWQFYALFIVCQISLCCPHSIQIWNEIVPVIGAAIVSAAVKPEC